MPPVVSLPLEVMDGEPPVGGRYILGMGWAWTGPWQNTHATKILKLRNPMARPRLPTALLALRGGFKNRPSRLRARQYEPIVTTPLPEPPDYLTTAATEAWREMESYGFWLTSADQFLVAIAATFMARYRIDGLKKSGEVSLLIGLLGTLGFSPKSRAALNLPTDTT
jgi:phage terminase small subunit